MKKLLNCTPHTINLITPSGVISLEPTGICPRVGEFYLVIDQVTGVQLVESELGEVEGLPDLQEDVLLIVSRMVAEAAADRADLVFPGQLVRDEKGRVIGASALVASKALAHRIDLLASRQAQRELWEDMRDDEGPLK